MTDDTDEAGPGSGVPERTERSERSDRTERSERTDSGAHATESGRHVTNLNVVPRERGGRGAGRDEFDVDTPVRLAPRDGFDDDAMHDAPTNPGPIPALVAAPSARLDRSLRGGAIALVLGLGIVGLASPASVLRGGAAWLAFLMFVLAGWGSLVLRITRGWHPAHRARRGVRAAEDTEHAEPVDDAAGARNAGAAGDAADTTDAGQRIALGAAGYLAVAGGLVALGLLSRPIILALIAVGFAGFAWREVTAPTAIWQRARDRLVYLRRNPALGALIGLVAAFACLRLIGAVCALDRNPWDDDLAYTPLIKRLLDTGNLIEPFSFRRLGSYGGQTALQALGAARGTLANVQLIDRGLGLGCVLLGVVGHARERRTQPLWLALIALTLLVLPSAAINTASYWTGVACFLALYRCAVHQQWALVGLVTAATCTLRQNLLVPACAFGAALLVARLIVLARELPPRRAWRRERRAWALAAGVALAAIAPWCLATYLSSGTFLFPAIDGTWNHALSVNPRVVTWPEELEFLVQSCLETAPITVIPLLALVLAFTRDARLGRPLAALAIASVLGFASLVHALVGNEVYHVWRYGFCFAAALTIVLVLEIGADDDDVTIAPLGRWILLAALVLQLLVGRGALPKQVLALLDDVREATAIDRRGDPSARAEQRRYAAMQAALPAGAPVIVMVDDPAYLDFRRNAIANLDTPGFASPDPQLPLFDGAEPLRAHLVAHGYRYAAFVRTERSRYFYARPFWLRRIFIDSEFFQIMSAYTLAAIDDFAELSTTTRVLYDADGLVVLDLASPLRAASTRVSHGDEPARRNAWVRELADREGLHDAWSLITRDDLRFEDGTAAVRFVDGAIDDPKWYEVSHPRPEPPRRGTAILPMSRRAHLRVRGTTDMRLVLRAAVALNQVFTHPRLDVSLDGELLASVVADATGHYTVDVTVPQGRLAGGWHDLYLVYGSIADPGRADPRELRIARLEAVEWSPP